MAGASAREPSGDDRAHTHLEALVLQHALDGGIFSARRHLGLKHDAKGAIPDNLTLCILHLLGLASHAILDLFADYLCGPGGGEEGNKVSSGATQRRDRKAAYPPSVGC